MQAMQAQRARQAAPLLERALQPPVRWAVGARLGRRGRSALGAPRIPRGSLRRIAGPACMHAGHAGVRAAALGLPARAPRRAPPQRPLRLPVLLVAVRPLA